MSPSLNNIPVYNFYNKEWYIAADIVKEYKLSSYYNTYYSKYLSNGRLLGPTKSFELRLSGTYLEEFKELYGSSNTSLAKSSAVWLVDKESANKIINKQSPQDKNTTTIESSKFSIEYNLGSTSKASNNTSKLKTISQSPIIVNNDSSIDELIKLKEEHIREQAKKTAYSSYKNRSSYSEEEISDAITLLSSKLTVNPYQQEKLLNNGSIRIDLFLTTRRNITAIELKNHTITLEEVKEKIENKCYMSNLIQEFPNLPITFVFSGPSGIDLDAFLYLQQTSKAISPHKIIYKPLSNLILDMINKKEKELPVYYYKQIINKPIIKALLQLE